MLTNFIKFLTVGCSERAKPQGPGCQLISATSKPANNSTTVTQCLGSADLAGYLAPVAPDWKQSFCQEFHGMAGIRVESPNSPCMHHWPRRRGVEGMQLRLNPNV